MEAAIVKKPPRVVTAMSQLPGVNILTIYGGAQHMSLHPLPCTRPAHHLCLAGELDKMVTLSFCGRENREGRGVAR